MNLMARITFDKLFRMLIVFLVLAGLFAGASATSAASTALDVGWADVVYGATMDDEPTGTTAESKLWFNDGFWWGALFNGANSQYEIFRYNADAHTWVSTGTALDTRKDNSEATTPPEPPDPDFDNRLDVLWKDNKLFVASHIDVLNGGITNNAQQVGKLFRYSYNTTTKLYTLDGGYPADMNKNKTEALPIDVDNNARVWTAYVSRTSTTAPFEWHVFVNTSGAGAANQATWAANSALDLVNVAAIGAGNATVSVDDIAAVVTYGTKTGIMWSNGLNGHFYYAEHDNTQAVTAGWTVKDLWTVAPISANDHMHLTTDAAGNVYAAIKAADDTIGVFKRDTAGVWSWHPVGPSGTSDSHPIIVINATTSTAHVFMSGNEGGGVICTRSAPTSTLAFASAASFNCNPSATDSLFIADADPYTRFDNASSTKQNVTSAMGLLVIASDDVNGRIYGHNFIGALVAPPDVISFTPAEGAVTTANPLVVTATFSEDMNAATINGSTFTVSGPGGPVAGTVAYNAGTRTATFTSSGAPVVGAYTATVTTGVQDATNVAMLANKVWSFSYALVNTPPTVTSTTPADAGTATAAPLVVTATFSEAMNPATITTSTFTVSGPGGAVAGTVNYDAPTMTATFTASAALPAGAYTATVTTGAQDMGGAGLAANKVWSFTYNPVVAPTVTATTPIEGGSSNAVPLVVTATFSKAMNAATITGSTFTVSGPGGPVAGTVTYDAATSKATFTSSGPVGSGTYTATVTTGAQDAGGLGLAADKVWTFTYTNLAPTVTVTTPANGGSLSGTQVVATATFSEAMNAATINASTFTMTGPGGAIPGNVSYDPGTLTATFTSTGPVVTGGYTATVTTGAQDMGGAALAASKIWGFTFTQTTAGAPTITLRNPAASGTLSSGPLVVKVTFSEPMDPSTINTGTIQLHHTGGAQVPATIGYDAATMTATLSAVGAQANGSYTVTVTTGVKDAGGTAMTAQDVWNFNYQVVVVNFPVYLPVMRR